MFWQSFHLVRFVKTRECEPSWIQGARVGLAGVVAIGSGRLAERRERGMYSEKKQETLAFSHLQRLPAMVRVMHGARSSDLLFLVTRL